VIVHNFDFVGVSVAPYETNPPLIVDANTLLPFAFSLQTFKTVSRQNGKRLKIRRGVQNV